VPLSSASAATAAAVAAATAAAGSEGGGEGGGGSLHASSLPANIVVVRGLGRHLELRELSKRQEEDRR
jgi:hypothetical protein